MAIEVGRDGLLRWESEGREIEIPYREGGWKKGKIRYMGEEEMFAVVFENEISIELGHDQTLRMGGKEYRTNLK